MDLKRWAKEPLVHFLLGGALLFAFFAWKGEPVDPASRDITITQEDRARMSLQWQQMMQRPPTDAELDSLTQVWLREEILYREALRLGLDRDDAVVRKRMANKMDFLATSIAETAKPSDAVLREWLADNPQRFADDTSYSFEQLYFAEKADAEAALARLKAGGDGAEAGEAISLPARVDAAGKGRIEGRFGVAFVEGLQSLDLDRDGDGAWAGPIVSGFGWHLVRLTGREVGQVPAFEDIRDQVENDWRVATMEQRQSESYQVLRDAYEVEVER